MLKKEVKEEYYDWIYMLLCMNRYSSKHTYDKLLRLLYDIPFTYINEMDANRKVDGINLRRNFAYYNDLDEDSVIDILDSEPCSVLEMMVALSIRCEDVMDDPSVGDRTAQWFWRMIVTLGLGGMTDPMFDRREARAKITRFLKRKYEPDGTGGLFKIKNCRADLRDVEIWTQMLWYMDSIT